MNDDIRQDTEQKLLWVDKYRPTNLKDYLLNEKSREIFQDAIKNNLFPNATFVGCPGSGKTTLAYVLCNEFNAEVLFIRCAEEGTLDTLRTKISEFCNSLSIEGKIKVVILDEIDSASSGGDNNFQKALRTLIEAHQKDTRFILTANQPKIHKAILSRCPQIDLTFSVKDLVRFLKKILDTEQIKYEKEVLKDFIVKTADMLPDCRKIIHTLQLCCSSGTLKSPENVISEQEKHEATKVLVDQTFATANLLQVRQYYLKNKQMFGDLLAFASSLFNYVVDTGIVDDPNAVLKLTDLLYQMNVVVDKEPTFFGMLVLIKQMGHT